MCEYLKRSDPNNYLASEAVPDELDGESPALDYKVNDGTRGVLLQAEDFGGVIPLPFYGFQRPRADYSNSME